MTRFVSKGPGFNPGDVYTCVLNHQYFYVYLRQRRSIQILNKDTGFKKKKKLLFLFLLLLLVPVRFVMIYCPPPQLESEEVGLSVDLVDGPRKTTFWWPLPIGGASSM